MSTFFIISQHEETGWFVCISLKEMVYTRSDILELFLAGVICPGAEDKEGVEAGERQQQFVETVLQENTLPQSFNLYNLIGFVQS